MNYTKFRLLLIYTFLLYPLLKIRLALRAKRKSDQLRILVMPQANRIGDLVCATPVFRAIKEKYPTAYLAVLVSKKSYEIIKHNPRIDEILLYESPRLLSHIRSRRFTHSFALTNSPAPSLIALHGLIPTRVKTTVTDPSLAERLTDCLNTDQILYQHHTYLPGHYLKMLEVVGILNAPEMKEVFPADSGRAHIADFLQRQGWSTNDFLVVIAVAAGNRIKEWPLDRFAQIADSLVEKRNAKILFIGAPHDRGMIRDTIALMKQAKGAVAEATEFAIHELPALAEALNLFIGVDTGFIYIADALKIPLIDITGPCDPREQPPQNDHAICVLPTAGIEYSSFVMKRAGPKENHDKAVKSITAKMVLEAINKLLSGKNLV